MGTAKDLLKWHGKEQRYYVADLLAPFAMRFLFPQTDQLENFDTNYNALTDTFLNGVHLEEYFPLCAHKEIKAWLVVAFRPPLC